MSLLICQLMNRLRNSFLLLAALLLAASCVREKDPVTMGAVKMSGIHAVVLNGAESSKAVEALADSVGRTSFKPGEKMHFTRIARSSKPIEKYTYADVVYKYSSSKTWTRDKADQEDNAPLDIYWSDAGSAHTFIGYSLPKPKTAGFDWVKEADGHYYGSIGVKGATGRLKFVAPPADPDPGDEENPEGEQGGGEPGTSAYGTADTPAVEETTLRDEDIFLTYHDNLGHKDDVAFVDAHHGLSSIRVTVQISGFSTSDKDNDHKATVRDLIVKDQPVDYRWGQTGFSAEAVPGSQNKRDMELYIPNPEGKHHDMTNNAFVFYGITVPQTELVSLDIQFTVTYPDPKQSDSEHIVWKDNTYTASLAGVKFDGGYCTSIIINLNHQNEEITVGASYNDWIYVETPDYGDLDRIQVFLKDADTAHKRVTVHKMAKATKDDATWLYKNEEGNIVDIYGHTGNEDDPYMIRNADQLLSLAYEVNGISGISDGWDFSGKFITLDSGIILQSSNTASGLKWPGIGVKVTPGSALNVAAGDRPFNGTFLGGVRLIKRLEGKPFFGYIGPLGHVDQLLLEDVLDIDGAAAYVTQNDGIICAAKVASEVGGSFQLKNPITVSGLRKDETDNQANITWTDDDNGETTIAAPFVAYNNGVLMACYCTGNYTTSAKRSSGIVGYNNGAMVVDYSGVKGGKTDPYPAGVTPFYRGTVAYNRYDPNYFIAHPRPHGQTEGEEPVELKLSKKSVILYNNGQESEAFTVSLAQGSTSVPITSYSWSVDNTSVATLQGESTAASVSVKAAALGETKLRITVTYSGGTLTDYIRVKVIKPKTNPVGAFYGALTYCFFDYQVAGVNPGLALGQVYGMTTAEMQARGFIGSPDYSNENTETLNGSIHVWAMHSELCPDSIIQAYKEKYTGIDINVILNQLSLHFKSRYYVFHVASYPWVY